MDISAVTPVRKYEEVDHGEGIEEVKAVTRFDEFEESARPAEVLCYAEMARCFPGWVPNLVAATVRPTLDYQQKMALMKPISQAAGPARASWQPVCLPLPGLS